MAAWTARAKIIDVFVCSCAKLAGEWTAKSHIRDRLGPRLRPASQPHRPERRTWPSGLGNGARRWDGPGPHYHLSSDRSPGPAQDGGDGGQNGGNKMHAADGDLRGQRDWTLLRPRPSLRR